MTLKEAYIALKARLEKNRRVATFTEATPIEEPKTETTTETIASEEQKAAHAEKNIPIVVSKANNYYKVEINDFVTSGDFVDKKKSSEEYSILGLIPSIIFWNSSLQKINKGTYYIIDTEDGLFSLLFTDEEVSINERRKKDLDEDERKHIAWSFGIKEEAVISEPITKEKNITLYLNDNDVSFSSLKHRSDGDTYETRYYRKSKELNIGHLELTPEEAKNEMEQVLAHLGEIEGIETIVNLGSLKEQILSGIKERTPRK